MIVLEDLAGVKLSSQEIYDIINDALEDAKDNGFLNSFVFERSLLCHEVMVLFDDIDENIIELVKENPLLGFDKMFEEGLLSDLLVQHGNTVVYVADIANTIYRDYNQYLLSFAGGLNIGSNIDEASLEAFSNQLQGFIESDDVQRTLEIADEWGLNRPVN